MKYFLLLFVLSIIAFTNLKCSQDEMDEPLFEEESIIGVFTLDIEGKESIDFKNPECEFDNRDTQSQFNYNSGGTSGSLLGYTLFSTYVNIDDRDSTTSQFWFHLLNIFKEGQSKFDTTILREVLESEVSSENLEFLIPKVQVEVCGLRYDNDLRDNDRNTPPYWIVDDFYFKINDFNLPYDSDCIAKEVLYVNIDISGKLYNIQATDSIYINSLGMELLFDIEE